MTEPSSLSRLADDVVREMYSSLPTQWHRDCLRTKVLTALNAALRAAPAQGEPVAWVCSDDRYPFLKGIVTDRQVTVDAWREGDVKFDALVRAALPSSPAPAPAPHNPGERDPSVMPGYGAGEAISPADLARDCAKIAESHVGAGGSGESCCRISYDEACRDIAKAIMDAHGGQR